VPVLRFAITRDGVRVAYQVVGQGAPLLLIHGLGDDRTLWSELSARLSPHYTCITLDLRGHGETTGSLSFGLFELSRDLEAVVSEARLRNVALVGHSLGAFVATLYAASSPWVRAVINIDQPLMLDAFAPIVRPHEAALRQGKVKEVYFEVTEALGLGPMPPALRARLEATREQLAPEVVLGVWGPMLDPTVTNLDVRMAEVLTRVTAPYLCLFGHDAAPEYLAWLRAQLPQVEVESWSGLGHFLHLLEPARFCERVRQFVG
jgi:pimeloyl-ACP methyl ester carboxylesterase